MAIDTNVCYFKDDVNKNLYRKKTYYTLVVEQEVLADNKDDADKLFTENGIDHSKINSDITETKDGVETYMVDANYTESDTTKYMGKVLFTDEEYAEEDGDVEIDTDADEVMPDVVDTQIQLEAELARGK
jgi:hypothetical protein